MRWFKQNYNEMADLAHLVTSVREDPEWFGIVSTRLDAQIEKQPYAKSSFYIRVHNARESTDCTLRWRRALHSVYPYYYEALGLFTVGSTFPISTQGREPDACRIDLVDYAMVVAMKQGRLVVQPDTLAACNLSQTTVSHIGQLIRVSRNG